MASSSRTIKPESLPSTEQAIVSCIPGIFSRVELQEWNTTMESNLDPND